MADSLTIEHHKQGINQSTDQFTFPVFRTHQGSEQKTSENVRLNDTSHSVLL